MPSDKTRGDEIVENLRRCGEATVETLAERLGLSKDAVSQALRTLREAGLVEMAIRKGFSGARIYRARKGKTA